MPKTEMDYSQTIIYKICCKDVNIKELYVGHTINFTQRKNQHKTACNTETCDRIVYNFIRNNGGWDNWNMIQIEEYNCTSKREAEMRERYWIETLQARLNCIIPITTKEEKIIQQKDWYEENKESILEKVKQQYEENKEVKLEYQKEYVIKHKEQIKDYQDEYREKNKEKLAEQKKEYRKAHKEEAAKAQKAWREANKEKLKEEKAKIYQCECGNEYTFGNKHRHLQTKIHIEYQNKLNRIIAEEQDNIPKVTEEENKQIQKNKQKEYREKNAEKIKQNRKKYNENNKEKVSEQCKKYKQENKEKVLEQTKKYTEENKEKIKQKSHEWYEKNKEKILNRMQQVSVAHPFNVVVKQNIIKV
jgi:hypothetical protein